MQHEMDAFLQALFAGVENAYFHLWQLTSKKSYWYSAANLDDYFAETATGVLGDEDVYVGAGVLPAPKGDTERTVAHEVIGIPAMWADIDYQDPLHKKSNLPRDMEHALEIVDSYPVKPTIIMQSGHGIQCWWLFQEPWMFADDTERQQAADMLKRWQATLRAIGMREGCTMDSTHDLARLMRVPGTWNCKNRDEPRPVVVYSQNDERYNPSDFEEFLIDLAAAEPAVQVALATPVDATLTPPHAKFMALWTNNSAFGAYYEHKKKPANDDSLSGYDLCLANIAVNAHWTDDEIVALLIQHRLHWKAEIKHQLYYERTVARARTRSRFESASAPSPPPVQPGEAASGAEAAPASSERRVEREATIEMVSDNLGIPIHRFIKYEASPPRYRLILKDGREISLGGAETLQNQARFQTKMIELANFMPQKMKQGDWTVTVNMLHAIVEVESMGDGMTELGKVKDWLHNYLLTRAVAEADIERAVASKTSFVHGGAIYIFSRTFMRYLHEHLGERVDPNEVTAIMTRLGIRDEVLPFYKHGRRTTTSARRLPPLLFSPFDYASADTLAASGDEVLISETVV